MRCRENSHATAVAFVTISRNRLIGMARSNLRAASTAWSAAVPLTASPRGLLHVS